MTRCFSLPFAVAIILGITGCAEQARRVPAAYIPSIVYAGASCYDMQNEIGRLASYVSYVTSEQRRAARSDTSAVIIGTTILWPVLLALPFSVDQSAQLAMARGHYDALIEAMRRAGCRGAAGSNDYFQAPARPVGQGSFQDNWKRWPGDFPPM